MASASAACVSSFASCRRRRPAGRCQCGRVRGGQRVTLTVEPGERRIQLLGVRWTRACCDDFDAVSACTRSVHLAAPRLRSPRAAAPSSSASPVSGLPGVLRGAGGSRLGDHRRGPADQLGEYFGVKHGVLVTSVTDGSAAAKAGVKAGDVITAVNGRRSSEPADCRRRARAPRGRRRVHARRSMRDKKPQTLKGKLEPRTTARPTVVEVKPLTTARGRVARADLGAGGFDAAPGRAPTADRRAWRAGRRRSSAAASFAASRSRRRAGLPPPSRRRTRRA